ncbi:pyruvate,orthophosphate dikinase [Kibdelosporangium banguiense]|uniref:Pyruvate,orthophosphate dikinase n=1 Tax=Kibdelosporangium banguiense TaxID=1365924 RepID=A0ABS4TW00_9PSEU|nr:pyruvate, phosphate dikinase [Kibdelosporangium banguiense]MBP2328577.1 pyruvate,orthophosphate dikinase [Kibdelosporangium banguiense]
MPDPGRRLVVPLDGTIDLSHADIGDKAWNINRMRALGLPVPPAVVATTAYCRSYHAAGGRLPDPLWQRIVDQMWVLEAETGRSFGSPSKPLLVAVRSGAARSMPGMLDTVLDVGINSAIESALAAETQDPAYPADTHRRFIEAYRHIVLGMTDAEVPSDPWQQLRGAVEAVLASWNSPRARAYRRHRGIPDDGGTAVIVQAMVFGNLDDRSGTGVLFTRNPMTGEGPSFGEWIVRGQGEDVVSGRADPQPLAALRELLPEVHAQLMDMAVRLERDCGDIQDIEFTVESGRLWLLQSRTARRSPRAALRAAVSMVDKGILEPGTALERVTAEHARALLGCVLDRSRLAGAVPVATGHPVCEGVATGVVVLDPGEAERRAGAGEDVVLARSSTSPDDLPGFIAARAVLTEHGGSTSHAAVVSRELGRVCVVGCGEGTVTSLAGQQVTVDGAGGVVWLGEMPLLSIEDEIDPDLARLIDWAQARVPLAVRRHAPAGSIDELTVLRLVGLKRRIAPEMAAHSLGADRDRLDAVCLELVEHGLCTHSGSGLRLTPDGRRRLSILLAEERMNSDQAVAGRLYREFCGFNGELKQIITDWQLRDNATPNDHADAAYDQAVLHRLRDLHERVKPLLDRLGDLAPRLRRYAPRFGEARARLAEGDHTFIANISKDSFHTLWFELHEDLLSITGDSRESEVAAGRAL